MSPTPIRRSPLPEHSPPEPSAPAAPTPEAPRPQIEGYRIVPERPKVERRWLFLAMASTVVMLMAFAAVTVLWVGSRNDLQATGGTLKEVRDERNATATELGDVRDQMESLEGDLNGTQIELNQARETIAKAKVCLRGITKFLRTAELEAVRSVRSDCNAVLRAPGGGSAFA